MLDRNLIKKKIRSIQEYLIEVEDILSFDVQEILSDMKKLRVLERIFQLSVDAMTDINIHFIRELDLKSPDDL